MGRRHYKNTSNNRKTNMTPPESRDSTPATPEHSNTDEAEESSLKNNFMQMIETLSKKMRKFFREMEEKTNQKMQEIKDSQGNTIKQLKETVQDLKTEIETMEKTQSGGMLEVEKLSKQSGTSDASIMNQIQEMEDRISDAEDKLEDINSSSKESLNSNKALTQNIKEIWDTMKRSNLRIIGIEEELAKTILKFIWKNKRPRIPKTTLYNKITSRGITIVEFKLYYRGIALKTVCYWHKSDRQLSKLYIKAAKSIHPFHLVQRNSFQDITFNNGLCLSINFNVLIIHLAPEFHLPSKYFQCCVGTLICKHSIPGTLKVPATVQSSSVREFIDNMNSQTKNANVDGNCDLIATIVEYWAVLGISSLMDDGYNSTVSVNEVAFDVEKGEYDKGELVLLSSEEEKIFTTLCHGELNSPLHFQLH
ncbi:GTPase IMAP family member 3-like protein [Cricetulus griseus]|nr:GTPase IMAP family member 3-like protein [Cricetulus griseus]